MPNACQGGLELVRSKKRQAVTNKGVRNQVGSAARRASPSELTRILQLYHARCGAEESLQFLYRITPRERCMLHLGGAAGAISISD